MCYTMNEASTEIISHKYVSLIFACVVSLESFGVILNWPKVSGNVFSERRLICGSINKQTILEKRQNVP